MTHHFVNFILLDDPKYIFFSLICFCSSNCLHDQIFFENVRSNVCFTFLKFLNKFMKYLARYLIKCLQQKVSIDFWPYSVCILFFYILWISQLFFSNKGYISTVISLFSHAFSKIYICKDLRFIFN